MHWRKFYVAKYIFLCYFLLRVPRLLMDDGYILLDERDMHKYVPNSQVCVS